MGDEFPRLSVSGADVRFLMSPDLPTDGAFPRNSDASKRRPKATVGYKKRRAAMLGRDRQYNYWEKKASVSHEKKEEEEDGIIRLSALRNAVNR